MSLLEDFNGKHEGVNETNGVVESKLSRGSMMYCCRSLAEMCCYKSGVEMRLVQDQAITCLL